jgi:hypothetical protein
MAGPVRISLLATKGNAYFLPPTLRGMTGPVRILLATNKNAYFLAPTLRMTGPVRILLATNKNAYFLPPILRMTSCWPPIRMLTFCHQH